MAVTLKDIAKKARVSPMTVSKIIRGGNHRISQETEERVLKIAKDMGYVPNGAARSLKTRKSKTIGFVLPDIANPFFPEIARGLDDQAKNHGYSVLMCNTDNDADEEVKAFRKLAEKMVDGIVFIHSVANDNSMAHLNLNVPVVYVDRAIKDADQEDVGQIFLDVKSAFYDATRLLIEKGCQNIAFISALYKGRDYRCEGYSKALEENKLSINDLNIYRGKYDVDTGSEGVSHILKNNPHIDGIVCGDDLIAYGVIEALLSRNLRIPEDVKVIGFDDIYFSQYSNPKLTTIAQPAYQMGVEAGKMLINHIENGSQLYRKKMDYSLKIRKTV